MKKLLFLLVQFFFSPIAFTQSGFQRTYGGQGNERAHGIVETQDGGYAITGHTDSFGAGQDDIFILKIDGNGNIQWQKTFGGVGDDNGLSIAIKETPDSGFVVTGSSSSFSNTPSDLYVFKVDSTGNLLWDFKYDSGPSGNSKDHGRGLLNCSNRDILILGTDDSNEFGSNDGIILRVDEDGILIWKNIFGGSGNDHFHEAIELPGGNFLVCGSSQSFGPGNTAAYVMKISGTGNIIWGKTYGGSAVEGLAACDKTEDFGIIATGLSSSYTSYSGGSFDVLLCKIDSTGTLQWTKTFGGPDVERGASVKALPDGSGYVVAAFTDSYGNGNRDILIIRTNTTGDLVWSKTFGTKGFEGVDLWSNCSLSLTNEDGFVIAGWSDSLSVGGEDVLFLKTDIMGSSLCADVTLVSSSPIMTTINTVTNTANVGTYTSISSIVIVSSMVERGICDCIPDTLCNGCVQISSHIDVSGNIDCTHSSVQLSVTGAATYPEIIYHWTNALDEFLSADSWIDVTQPGMYYLLIIDTLNNCEVVDSHFVVDLTGQPPSDAGEDRTLNCDNPGIQLEANTGQLLFSLVYSWSGPSGGISTDSLSRIIIVNLGGQYTLTVLDTMSGCISMDTVIVIDDRDLPIADAGPSQIVQCLNTSVVLDGSQSSSGPEYVYQWIGPGIVNAAEATVEAQMPGWYYLHVFNVLTGCEALDSTEIIAIDVLSGSEVLVHEPSCFGESNGQIIIQLPLGGTPPYLYSLDGGQFQSSPEFNGLSAGKYLMSIKDDRNCEWSSTMTIPEGTALSLDLGPDLMIHVGSHLNLHAAISTTGIVDSMIWSPSDKLSCVHCLNPVVHAVRADTFHISATVYSGSCIASDDVLVIIYDESVIFVPNIFSPNKDNINDYVTVFSNDGFVRVVKFEIFDRWGNLVFRGTDFPINTPELGWDGRCNGELMNPAVFAYVARVQLSDGSIEIITGDITLVR
ncbi:MAG TPA: gliding motility-associated C-terminal domain-containing protein [Saprospiraceae bacterium]|nr:gliding motility-associated C-terminal domain-containing protein [Saprospiraceae bacterium]